jgi:2-polyprenyl-3-methyl-5-hydroxy-6-metoxy-1,4-benzoquinol methylase
MPFFYQFLQSLVRNDKHIRFYVDNFIKVQRGQKILDIGCGPADILAFFPENIEYTGFDASEEYINNAKLRFGNKAQFFCKNVSTQVIEELNLSEKFDIVIANNVLHHLTDEEAADLFKIAKQVLAPQGRLITCDPCRIKKDNIISTLMINLDRGKFVRTPEIYLSLAAKEFSKIKHNIVKNLSNIPITGLIMECEKQL